MAAYYNEFDPYAAQWLRNLIAKGLIAPGDVDTRSIEDVHPDDLRGYDQCHFFAGIGGWSLAARLAGIPDEFPLWTGSCPCQPFSAAGQGAGFADERHLWPHFHHLIRELRPPVVAGEQVASAAVGPWLDLVQTDLEADAYAFGAVPFPAAGIGAPHIRDRTYWLGHAYDPRLEGLWSRLGAAAGHRQGSARSAATAGEPLWLADDDLIGFASAPVTGLHDAEHHAQPCGGPGGLGDAADEPCERISGSVLGSEAEKHGAGVAVHGRVPVGFEHAGQGVVARPGPVNGFWADADWLLCRDGKWRPVEPGTFPLAHGVPGRVGRLRAYGNAIVPEQAAIFLAEAVGAILAGVRGPDRLIDPELDLLLG